MTVQLENFLSCRSIAKVRKLVRIIRESNTPECEEKIREFIEQELEQYEPEQKDTNRYIVGYTEKVNFYQKQLDISIRSRDGFKRKSEGWEQCNEHVKAYQDILRDMKLQLRSYQKQFDQRVKNREFYRKVLEIIT